MNHYFIQNWSQPKKLAAAICNSYKEQPFWIGKSHQIKKNDQNEEL